jgi:hypothetical protein
MHYVRMVEDSKRVGVEAGEAYFRKSWSRIGQMAKTATVACGCKCLKTNGGAEGDRTPDLRIANAALCQTELLPHSKTGAVFKSKQVMGENQAT